MSNGIFDQAIVPIRQRPSSTDLNRAQSQLYRTLRAVSRMLLAGRTNDATPFANDGSSYRSGFVGDGFKVGAASPAAMSVVVRPGMGFIDASSDTATDIDAASAVDDRERYKPVALETAQTIAVPTADVSNPRIDIVEVAYDRRAEEPTAVDIKAVVPPFNFVATTKNKVLAWLQDGRTSVNGAGGGLAKINYKTGTPAGSPTAPTVTAGYVKIAEVLVGAGVTTIPQNKVKDSRTLLSHSGQLRAAFRATISGTGAGPLAPVIQGAVLPPGCSLAVWQIIAGGNFNVALIAGGSPKMPVPMFTAEGPSPGFHTVGSVAAPTIAAITSGELSQIAATGMVVGPPITEGQIAVKMNGAIYMSGITPIVVDSVLVGSIDFASY